MIFALTRVRYLFHIQSTSRDWSTVTRKLATRKFVATSDAAMPTTAMEGVRLWEQGLNREVIGLRCKPA